jgi:hypothetical protein
MKIKENVHYIISIWNAVMRPNVYKGYSNFSCVKCQYSTLIIEKMQEHWDKESQHNHPWAYPDTDNPMNDKTDIE